MKTWERLCKRALDIAAAGAGLAAIAPCMIGIGAAIKLDSPGPALFRQKRLGKGGAVFDILKFRTMREGASLVIGADHTVVNPVGDERVTRVGRFLRHTSLDELPQLINVLCGDMSLVGPRPDLPEGLSVYDEQQRRKLDVQPGITGWAQVSGRNLLTAEEKWTLDVEYVDRASARMDLEILVKTAVQVIRRKGVYNA
jgi:lipopolysaccharide/colanic/teichoic acid biosynthesis glycosyltransferase